jgi:hypothetical protein
MKTFSKNQVQGRRFCTGIVIGAVIAISMAGCGPVEVDSTVGGFMPVFLTNLIAKGFWGAILAMLIFNIPVAILGFIFRKINRILYTIVLSAPNAFFFFYIWHIRGYVIWLIMAILGALGFILVLVDSIKKKPDANTPV